MNVAVAGLLAAAGMAQGQQILWAAPVSGDFLDPTKWVGGVVPNANFDAVINATGTSGYTVSLGANRTVKRLIVNGDASTAMHILPGADLLVQEQLNAVFNTGTIIIGEANAPAGTDAELVFTQESTRFNGSGFITMRGYPTTNSATISRVAPVHNMIIGENLTVQGAGLINGGTGWINNGLIRANVPGHTLRLLGPSMINGGTLRAASGGRMEIETDVDQLQNAKIIVDAGSTLQVTSATVRNGEIDNSDGGTSILRNGVSLSGVVLRGLHTTTDQVPLITILVANPVGLINEGTIVMPLSAAGSPRSSRLLFQNAISGPVDVGGTGTIRFDVPAGLVATTNSFISWVDATSTEFIRMPGQNVEGNLTFRSSVRVGRTLSPGLAAPERVGVMRFQRVLRMNDNSEVLLDVQGATPNLRDTLEAAAATAALTLDNNVTLRLRIGGGFVPADGDVQTIINLAGSTVSPAIVGTFASVQVENAPAGVRAQLVYTANAVRVRWSVGGCDDIDFNNNEVFPEDQDVIDFFNVLAGADCAACNDIDFNNNEVFPEDQDVIDFFNVLAGAECS